MLRPTWLTMPAVVVSGRLNGLPIATTGFPTATLDELARAIGCSSDEGTFTWITPTSVDGSLPSTFAGTLRPFWKVTVTFQNGLKRSEEHTSELQSLRHLV